MRAIFPLVCFGLAAVGAAQAPAALQPWLDSEVGALEALYRDLHRKPELSFHETETAARLARELAALGLAVTEQVELTNVQKNILGEHTMGISHPLARPIDSCAHMIDL